jgi:hypothetical protein
LKQNCSNAIRDVLGKYSQHFSSTTFHPPSINYSFIYSSSIYSSTGAAKHYNMDPLELWTSRNHAEDVVAIGLENYIQSMRRMIYPVLTAYVFPERISNTKDNEDNDDDDDEDISFEENTVAPNHYHGRMPIAAAGFGAVPPMLYASGPFGERLPGSNEIDDYSLGDGSLSSRPNVWEECCHDQYNHFQDVID